MKAKLLLLPLMLLAFWACQTEDGPKPSIELINASAISETDLVSATGGTFSLQFNSTTTWKAELTSTSPGEWITISNKEGEGGLINISLTTTKNDEPNQRVALLTISSGDVKQELTITQEMSSMKERLATTSLSAKKEKDDVVVTFYSGFSEPETDFSVEWLSIAKLDDSKTDRYIWTIDVEENTGIEKRTGEFTITSSSGEVFTAKINQDGAIFNIIEESIEVGRRANEFTIKIDANVPYEVELPKWINEVPSNTRAADRYELTFAALENASSDMRIEDIVFKPEGIESQSISISQDGYIFETLATVKVSYFGGALQIDTESNANYSIVSMPTWLSQPAKRSTDQGKLEFHAEANDGAAREGVITLNIDEAYNLDINVVQDAYEANPEWLNKDFYKKSQITRFTGTWCGWCPVMAKAISLTLDAHPDRIVAFSTYSGSTPTVNYHSTELDTYYKIQGYPSAVMDGRVMIQNVTPESANVPIITAVAEETKNEYPKTATGAAITSSIANGKLSLEAKIFSKEAGNFELVALVTEDHIIANQACYYPENAPIPDYEHNGVVKEYFTALTGNTITFSEKGYMYYNASMNLPSTIQNEDNLNIVVFIKRASDNIFTNVSNVVIINKGEYVDNAFTVPVGETLELRFEE